MIEFLKNMVMNVVQAVVKYIFMMVSLRNRYITNRKGRIRFRYIMPFIVLAVVFTAYLLGALIDFSKLTAVEPNSKVIAGYNDPQGVSADMAYAQDPSLSAQSGNAHDDNVSALQEVTGDIAVAMIAPVPEKKAPEKKEIVRLKPKESVLKLGKGGTLTGVLDDAGFTKGEAYKMVQAMQADYDPRDLKVGQEIHIRYDANYSSGKGVYEFSEMVIHKNPIDYVSVVMDAQGQYKSSVKKIPVEKKLYSGDANIEVSLYGSSLKAGIPESVIADLIYIYSWDVDFQRDIRQGDQVDVLYEQLEDKDGKKVASGDILYARLNVNGEDIPVYRYERSNGDVDYYTIDGRSVRKALMKTPIDGARLSSGFGMRKHPVLGYGKMHKGIDFAAPRGTPIYAAGDGTLEYAGRFSSYGNYIRIRHNSSLKTAYAHMNNLAKGMSVGKRVKQGQIIGYVGTTGRSTGPHLHYEVLKNNVQVNPKNLKLPQGDTLKGDELARFKTKAAKLDKQYSSLRSADPLVAYQ